MTIKWNLRQPHHANTAVHPNIWWHFSGFDSDSTSYVFCTQCGNVIHKFIIGFIRPFDVLFYQFLWLCFMIPEWHVRQCWWYFVLVCIRWYVHGLPIARDVNKWQYGATTVAITSSSMKWTRRIPTAAHSWWSNNQIDSGQVIRVSGLRCLR